ncbi:MAG TPA: NADH-quinone oxidoreductase subunit C [Gaiellaceae bacterium]|nr:NADH-quinone oxidoreductase subunit C [Gaiellaceae bacterium]
MPAAAGSARRGNRPPPGEDQGRRAAGLRDSGRSKLTYEGVPGLVERTEAYDETTLVVDPARLVEACTYLHDEEGFDFLSDITPTDYLGWGEAGIAGYYGTAGGRDLNEPAAQGLARSPQPKPARFAVNYHLLAVRAGAPRVRLQVWIEDGRALPSVVSVWPTADWHEREAFDLMGIRFEGHPHLRRIIMEDDWEGHPLRKDYPLGGEPVRFSGDE